LWQPLDCSLSSNAPCVHVTRKSTWCSIATDSTRPISFAVYGTIVVADTKLTSPQNACWFRYDRRTGVLLLVCFYWIFMLYNWCALLGFTPPPPSPHSFLGCCSSCSSKLVRLSRIRLFMHNIPTQSPHHFLGIWLPTLYIGAPFQDFRLCVHTSCSLPSVCPVVLLSRILSSMLCNWCTFVVPTTSGLLCCTNWCRSHAFLSDPVSNPR
jgi:hypothetical protein